AWLTCEIVRCLAPSHWALHDAEAIEPGKAQPIQLSRRQRWPVETINGIRLWQRILLSLFVQILPRKTSQFGPSPAGSDGSFPPAYLKLVDRLVQQTLPETLGQQYVALEADAAEKRYFRGRLYICCVDPHDDQSSMMLAHALEAGERIVNVQH